MLIERAHGDGIKVSYKSPEAFEEVFWMTFNDLEEDTIRKFKKYIQLIKHEYDKNRYFLFFDFIGFVFQQKKQQKLHIIFKLFS